MLTPSRLRRRAGRLVVGAERQGGAVLLIAMIILVALTLGGLALVRSVSTTTMIAGNLAFHQAATASADAATQSAVATLVDIRPLASQVSLTADHLDLGYCASLTHSNTKCPGASVIADDPGSWDTYWAGTSPAVVVLPTDQIGNSVSYVVQRLCDKTGDPTLAGCMPSPERYSNSGNGGGPGSLPLPLATQVYYRVTARVAGPRNSISYVQTIIAK